MTNLEKIEGIGPKTVLSLNKLGIFTIHDLITYYPYRYEIIKRSDISDIKDGDKITIDGIVEGQPTVILVRNGLRKMIFRINTGTNIFNITLYNQNYLYDQLKYGKEVTIIGKYSRLKNSVVASEIRLERLAEVPRIEPVYYATSGLTSKNISRFIKVALSSNVEIKDYIPEYLKTKYKFNNKDMAIRNIHNPSDVLSLKKAKQRLKYEELFVYLLKIEYMKRKNRSIDYIERNIEIDEIIKFINKLPFKLTEDQYTSIKDIVADLNSSTRMNRLLQGDVGSGKTIVAFISVYANYLSGYQSAMMVPTSILANQHYNNAKSLFKDYDINICLLTSNNTKKEREKIYKDLKNGNIDLIIGTQSLIQEKIEYANLGLVITDEQHRFGVNQRSAFKNKGKAPDVLSMSATPIPRTYALTVYGDMDVSNIRTKPAGRKEVKTYLKKDSEIIDVLNMIKKELDLNHQIYVIVPSIDGNSEKETESVLNLASKMEKAFGKIATISYVHGKMESDAKDKVMKDFEENKTNILISTTVIEVGVNVPNASMIVIFNANLFGLSTLHQLRGRVGRGDIQSYCVLIAKEKYERLEMLEKCNDGFEISEYDFKTRGEGDLFGVRQSGEIGLILADIKKDFQMLLRVKEDISEFVKNNDENVSDNLLEELMKSKNLD